MGIALVAVIALFLVYQGGKYIHKLAGDGPTLADISASTDTQNCPTCDPDHDGLTNAEEVLWGTDPFNADTDTDGFKDGEEVASGHNPLVPGPNDLLNSDNLTDQLSNLTVDGLAAGALNPASDSYQQSLGDITSSVADSGKYLFNKKVDESSLTLVSGSTQADTAYVQASMPLIQKFSDAMSSDLQNIQTDISVIGDKGFTDQMKTYFAGQADAYDELAQEATALSVPKPFSTSHAQFVSIVQQIRDADRALSQGDTDIVKSAFALDATGNVSNSFTDFLNSYVDDLTQEHIAQNKSLFSQTLASIASMTTQTAQANVVTTAIAKFTGCAAGGWLGNYIDSQLDKLKEKISKMEAGWVKDYLGKWIGVLGNSGSVPVNDGTLLSAWNNKYSRDDIIARCLARAIINTVTNNTNTIIRTRGRDGGPTFVTNWRNFLAQAQYRGENLFRAELSTANLCSYFSNDLKKSYGLKPTDRISLPGVNVRVDGLQPFSLQTNCTLPKNFDPVKYQQNFAAQGGWDTAAKLAQPQNNLYGATLLAQDEVNRQRSFTQSEDTAQVQSDSGQTGISGNGKNDSCAIKGFGGTCIVYKNIKTSGQYLADSAAASITAEYAWLTTSQGLGTLIEDITQNMIDRLFDQTDTSDYSVAGPEPSINITPAPTGLDTPTPISSSFPTPTPTGPPDCIDACSRAFDYCSAQCIGGGNAGSCYNGCLFTRADCVDRCVNAPTPTPTCDPTSTTCTTTPPPPFDLSQATIVGGSAGDVATWPQTATMTNVSFNGAQLTVDFTKRTGPNRWADQCDYPKFGGDCIQYTVWVFESINSQWYGTGFQELWYDLNSVGRPGDSSSIESQIMNNWVSKMPPLSGHFLSPGEQIGIMVTTGDERLTNQADFKERSDVKMVTLP